jgi:hypothetical protein
MPIRNPAHWVIGAATVGIALYVLNGDPVLPVQVANGTYANPAMGEIVLHDGRMAIEGNYVSYVVKRDKGGPYVLPKSYVTISSHKFLVDRGRGGLKLRLSGPEHFQQIELDDDDTGDAFPFTRRNGS